MERTALKSNNHTSLGGALLCGALVACTALAFSLALPDVAGAADTVGAVSKQRMDAYGTPPGGDRERKYPRYDVVFGELIETSGGGAILIRLQDETELYIGERASLTIDEFVYDPLSKQGGMVVDFTIGTLRFVSGAMDNAGVTIQTPNAHIGIRGSDAVIFVTPEGDTFVNVTEGRFSVRSRARADAPAVSLDAGQNVSLSGAADFSPVGQGIKMPEYSHEPDALVPDYSDDLQYLKDDGGLDKVKEGTRDSGGSTADGHSDSGGHHGGMD